MPLVWTHAEFLQLYVARSRGAPMDFLRCVDARYHGVQPRAATWHWRAEVPFTTLPEGRALVIEDRVPFTLHLGFDGWSQPIDRPAEPLGLGMFGVRFATVELTGKTRLLFTRRYGSEWEGKDWEIGLGA
jgi:glucoamylase